MSKKEHHKGCFSGYFVDFSEQLLCRPTKEQRPYPICHSKRQNEVFGSTHLPTPENVRRYQIFFCCKTSYKGTFGNSNCKRPTNYIMITLFKQARKYYNQNNKILHLASHMALQAAPLICTTIVTGNRKFLSVSCNYSTTEPSNSLPESSDRYEQL